MKSWVREKPPHWEVKVYREAKLDHPGLYEDKHRLVIDLLHPPATMGTGFRPSFGAPMGIGTGLRTTFSAAIASSGLPMHPRFSRTVVPPFPPALGWPRFPGVVDRSPLSGVPYYPSSPIGMEDGMLTCSCEFGFCAFAWL